MKKILITSVLYTTVLTASGAFAAELTSSTQGEEKIGVVSVHGKNSLSEVQEALQQKAEDAGASSYKIIAAGGNNQQYGVANIYR